MKALRHSVLNRSAASALAGCGLLAIVCVTGCETNSGVEAHDAEATAANAAVMVLPRSAVAHLNVVEVYFTTTVNPETNISTTVRRERDLGPDILAFEIMDGNPPFRWRLNPSTLGTLTTQGRRASFTPAEVGGGFIVVTDSRQHNSSAAIAVRDTMVLGDE